MAVHPATEMAVEVREVREVAMVDRALAEVLGLANGATSAGVLEEAATAQAEANGHNQTEDASGLFRFGVT